MDWADECCVTTIPVSQSLKLLAGWYHISSTRCVKPGVWLGVDLVQPSVVAQLHYKFKQTRKCTQSLTTRVNYQKVKKYV